MPKKFKNALAWCQNALNSSDLDPEFKLRVATLAIGYQTGRMASTRPSKKQLAAEAARENASKAYEPGSPPKLLIVPKDEPEEAS